MRTPLLILLLLNSFGCSTNPKEVLSKKHYVKETVTVSARTFTASSCNSPSSQRITWQQQIEAANICFNDASKLALWGQRILEEHPDSPWGYFFMAEAALKNKKGSFALWLNHRAEELAPMNAILLYQRGRIFWLENDTTLAARWTIKALSENSDLSEALVFLGQIYKKTLKPKLAKKQFEKALSIDPDHRLAQKELKSLTTAPALVIGKTGGQQ